VVGSSSTTKVARTISNHVGDKVATPRVDQFVVAQDTTYIGVTSLRIVFDIVFQRLPDLVITYQEPRIRYVPKEGTFVYTPFTFFCTVMIPEDVLLEIGEVPKHTISSFGESKGVSNDPGAVIMKTIELQATGWNVVQFDENDIVVLRQDNFFINEKKGIDNKENISDESIWNYIWRKK
jgi:hypothetical protein